MMKAGMLTKGDRLIFSVLFFGALLSLLLCGLFFPAQRGLLLW